MSPFRSRRRSPVVFTDRKPPGPVRSLVVQRAATEGLVRVGLQERWHRDLYHRMLTLSWPYFMLLATVVYVVANAAFAALYLLQPGSIANARPGSFLDAFFFSVETFATVGYGVLAPATVYANTVMTVETLVGLMTVALTTGVLFARVSRPTARVLFARVAVVNVYNGQAALMLRMGNARRSQIVQAEVGLTLLRSETTAEGQFMRRFYDLPLARTRTPVFAMSYTAIHFIDETSPLYGMDAEGLRRHEIELLVTVNGLDETLGQPVHARASYLPDEIVFGHRYVDMFGVTEDGRRAIDYARFHLTEKLG
jgi:inward rectifier potassium channel